MTDAFPPGWKPPLSRKLFELNISIFRHENCVPFGVINAPNLWPQLLAELLASPGTPNPSWRSEIVSFSNGRYTSFGALQRSVKPSGSSGGHLQSEMRTWYTPQHIFMQDRGTWPSGQTLFKAGIVFQMPGVVSGAAGNGSTKTQKGAKKDGTVRYGEYVDPTVVRPDKCFPISMPESLLADLKVHWACTLIQSVSCRHLERFWCHGWAWKRESNFYIFPFFKSKPFERLLFLLFELFNQILINVIFDRTCFCWFRILFSSQRRSRRSVKVAFDVCLLLRFVVALLDSWQFILLWGIADAEIKEPPNGREPRAIKASLFLSPEKVRI